MSIEYLEEGELQQHRQHWQQLQQLRKSLVQKDRSGPILLRAISQKMQLDVDVS